MANIHRRISTALHGKTPKRIKAEMEINGSRLSLLYRQLNVYHNAVDNAPDHLVGVGRISYGDYRLDVFNRRVGRLIMRRMGV